MIIAIVGSRTFGHLDWVQEFVDLIPEGNFILSGGATGVDQVAVSIAKMRYLGFGIFPANWDKYGKSAGVVRNDDIAKMADVVVAFWDGESKGTKDVIDRANHRQKATGVVTKREDLDELIKTLGLRADLPDIKPYLEEIN